MAFVEEHLVSETVTRVDFEKTVNTWTLMVG